MPRGSSPRRPLGVGADRVEVAQRHRAGTGPLAGRAALGAAGRHGGAAVPGRVRDLRARQRARPGHRAAEAGRFRCGAGTTSRAWRWPRSATRRRPTAARSARHVVDRAGRAEHGHRGRRRARQPAAAAAAARRHVRQPRAGPGAAAGRALRRRDGHGQRRVPRGQPLLRPDHPARAADRDAAAGGPRAHRPGRLRAGDAGAAAGRAGRGVRLPGRALRAGHHHVPRPRPDRHALAGAAASSAAPSGRCSCWAAACGTPAPPQSALALAERARRAGRRDHRRAHAGAARPPAARRPARHHRLGVGQHARRRGGPGARGRHPAAGLHDGVVVGVRADVRLVTVNAARFDAVKHGALALVADADEALAELPALLDTWSGRRPGRPAARREGGVGRLHRRASRRSTADGCRPTRRWSAS